MRIVVTGGAGYVGSDLVRLLLAHGHQVHVIDNLMYGGLSIVPLFIDPAFTFAECDVCDRPALARELSGADAIVHLASLVGYPLCKKLPERARQVNVEGARNVAELAPAKSRIVYASSGSNYGEVQGVCTEDTPLNPLSIYGETKMAAEAIFLQRSDTVALRFATAFGLSPRPRLDLLINDFTWQAVHRKYLAVYERHFRRTFIHVTDMARAMTHMIENWERMQHRVYNVGHESLNFTKEDVVLLLKRRLDFLVHFADFGRDEDKRDYEVDYARIRAIGFATQIDIDHGLDELIRGLALMGIQNPYSNV